MSVDRPMPRRRGVSKPSPSSQLPSGFRPRTPGWLLVRRAHCAACGGTGDDYFDPRPLIANLAMAGGLCASFALGIYYAVAHVLVTQWEPNVDGRAVPR